MTNTKTLPTEDEIYRPGYADTDRDVEKYIRKYLNKEYRHKVKSFTYEFDCRRIYISDITWKEC